VSWLLAGRRDVELGVAVSESRDGAETRFLSGRRVVGGLSGRGKIIRQGN
jgi:hypothetical protein